MSYSQQLHDFQAAITASRKTLPAVRPSQSIQNTDGQTMLAANASPAQVLQAYLATGEPNLLSYYGVSTWDLRGMLKFSSFYRALTILAADISTLVTGRGLKVVNRDGDTVRTEQAKQAIQIVTRQPTNGRSATTFWADVVCELCLTGNALLRPARDMRGRATAFELGSTEFSYASHWSRTNDPLIYHFGYPERAGIETIPALDVLHLRYPQLGQGYTTRPGFAPSPVIAVVAATEIGRRLDKRIADWAEDNRRNLHVDLKTPGGISRMKTADDRARRIMPILDSIDNRLPVLTENTDISIIADDVLKRNIVDLQNHQSEEIFRVFGIPAPIAGVNVTGWGSGIESLKRLYYSTGLRPQLDRIFPALERELLPAGQRFLADTTDLMRGDSTSIREIIQALQGNQNSPPYATVDEIRHFAGLANADSTLMREREQWFAQRGAGMQEETHEAHQ